MRGTEERRETGGPTLPPSETISLDHLVRLKFPALPPLHPPLTNSLPVYCEKP